LEQYLHVYCNYQQNNWSKLLPLAEFAYNNAPSATTGVSPFFANKGYHPNLSVYPERDIASSRVHNFILNLDELQNTPKEEIAKAQKQYNPPPTYVDDNHRISKSANQHSSGHSISRRLAHQRNSPKSTSDHTR